MSDRLRRGGSEGQLVLLVEDEAIIALSLQDELEAAGYKVTEPFASCLAALSWLEQNRPELAVLDTMLNDGPCTELAIELKRRGVPFVVYSGHREDRNMLPEVEDVVWIEKPAPSGLLLEALAGLCERDVTLR